MVWVGKQGQGSPMDGMGSWRPQPVELAGAGVDGNCGSQ